MSMPIGGLSKLTGVKVPTIRYYEQTGLMPEPSRTPADRRVYGAEAVRRLRFIRHARELGFEVEAIRGLLALAEQPQASCDLADVIARRHIDEIDAKMSHLAALRAEVARMLDECSHGRVAECRVIEVLADHAECIHERH